MTEEDTFNRLKKSDWTTVNNELLSRCRGFLWTDPLVEDIAIKHGWSVSELYKIFIEGIK